jgi:hypothetical protein
VCYTNRLKIILKIYSYLLLLLTTYFDHMWSPSGENTNIHIRNYILWDMTSCSHLKANQRFGGTCRLHLHCRSLSEGRNQREADSKLDFFLGLVSDPEDRGNYIPEDRTLYNHAMRTSNPKYTHIYIYIYIYIYCHVYDCDYRRSSDW